MELILFKWCVGGTFLFGAFLVFALPRLSFLHTHTHTGRQDLT